MEFLWNDAACHHTTDTLLLSTSMFREAVTDSESKGEDEGMKFAQARKAARAVDTLIEGRGPEKYLLGNHATAAAVIRRELTACPVFALLLHPAARHDDLSNKSRNDPAGSSDQATSHSEPL